jgi:hypothetical protein
MSALESEPENVKIFVGFETYRLGQQQPDAREVARATCPRRNATGGTTINLSAALLTPETPFDAFACGCHTDALVTATAGDFYTQ